MMHQVIKLLLYIQLVWLIQANASEDVDEIEGIFTNNDDQQTPELTYKLLQAKIAQLDGVDKTGWVDKLRAYSDARELRGDKCTTAYIVKLNYYIKTTKDWNRNKLQEYLEDCFEKQINLCFENLPTQFEEAISNLNKVSQNAFNKFMQFIDPPLTPAFDFAIRPVFATKYEAIGNYLDWQTGRKLNDKSDFDCTSNCPIKEQYEALIKLCIQIYQALFTPATVMLYVIQLRPNKENEMHPALVEWYKKYKVAFDLSIQGNNNYAEFEKWFRAKRIGLSMVEKAKDLFMSLFSRTIWA